MMRSRYRPEADHQKFSAKTAISSGVHGFDIEKASNYENGDVCCISLPDGVRSIDRTVTYRNGFERPYRILRLRLHKRRRFLSGAGSLLLPGSDHEGRSWDRLSASRCRNGSFAKSGEDAVCYHGKYHFFVDAVCNRPGARPLSKGLSNAMTSSSRKLAVGTRVRVLVISESLLAHLPSDEVDRVRSMLGEVLEVDEIDEGGTLWVTKWWIDDKCHSKSHSLALDEGEFEVVE